MFDSLKRLYTMFKAEAHSALSKLEDPLKMAEQGILDLKKDLDGSLKSLAEIEAMTMQERQSYTTALRESKKYESQSIKLLNAAQRGQMETQKAESKAKEILSKKLLVDKRVEAHKQNLDKYEDLLAKMKANINKLENEIKSWEEEIKILKARQKVTDATTKLNQQLANVDTDSTMSRLERIREQVEEQEVLAESYESIVNEGLSLDEEIDRALARETSCTESTALEAEEPKEALNQKVRKQAVSELDRLRETLNNKKGSEANVVSNVETAKPESLSELELLRMKLNQN